MPKVKSRKKRKVSQMHRGDLLASSTAIEVSSIGVLPAGDLSTISRRRAGVEGPSFPATQMRKIRSALRRKRPKKAIP